MVADAAGRAGGRGCGLDKLVGRPRAPRADRRRAARTEGLCRVMQGWPESRDLAQRFD